MSLSVSHINVPEGFNFAIKMRPESCLLAGINKYYNPKRVANIRDSIYAIPDTGLYTWDGIECWVYNQEKQSYMVLERRKEFRINYSDMILVVDGFTQKHILHSMKVT